jgi:ABC-type glycerol-3-phosphate transport system substrate-binding protein
MKLYKMLAVLMVLAMLLAACGATEEPPPPPTEAPAAEEPAAEEPAGDWARQPMEETCEVVLSVESGAQEKTLGSFHDQIMEELNIDLQVVAHPFSEQYEIQYLDLSSGAGQFDVLSYWPMYTADFVNWLEPLGNIAPGGEEQVAADLAYDGVLPGYKWCYIYDDKFYSAQYDGDVKLLHYRVDLMTDEEEHAAFQEEYGYDFDIMNLTWDQYLDVARHFQRPDEEFYGTSEIAGFLAGFYLKDRIWGYGGHLFSYDDMMALEGESGTGESNFDICVRAIQNGQDVFNTASPPEAHSFEFEDARNQIIVHDRVAMHTMWPDGWKWANDPALASETAVCNVAVAEMPGFDTDGDGTVDHRPNENGGRVLAINKASKAKECAYKVLVFFQDPERTTELVYNNDTWLDPWRVEHVDPAAASHLCEGCDWNCEQYTDIITKSTIDGYPALQIPGAGRYHEVLERWGKKAWANQVTAEEACTGIQEEFNAITDEIGREAQIEEHKNYVDTVLKEKGLYP